MLLQGLLFLLNHANSLPQNWEHGHIYFAHKTLTHFSLVDES